MTTDEKVLLVKKAFNSIIGDMKFNFQVTPARIGSWIAIEFEQLNVEQMEAVCRFIRHYYTSTKENGFPKFMHISPKFTKSQGGYPALVLNENDVEKIFGHLS